MSQFPSNSKLYLDDDVVVRTKGLHEPSKETLQKLTQKIIVAWENEEFEKLSTLLSQYERLQGRLSPEFAGFRKQLPLRRYIQQLQCAKRSATDFFRSGLIAEAHASLEIADPELKQISSEDQCVINLLISSIRQLREKIEPAWINSEKEAIEKLISIGTEDSLKKAREQLAAFEQSSLPQRKLVAVHDELIPKINEAGHRRRIAQMNQAFSSKSWTSAIELAQEILRLDGSSDEVKTVLTMSKKAIRRRRMVFAGAVSVAGLAVFIGVGVHRVGLKKDFDAALATGQYDRALLHARQIKNYDGRAAAYIQFSDAMWECRGKQTIATKIPQIESAQRWEHWRHVVFAADQAAWVKGPLSTTDNLRQAKAYYESLLDRHSQVYPVLKECQNKQKKAEKILGVQTDAQWDHWRRAVLVASTNWLQDGLFLRVMNNLKESDAYYSSLLKRGVGVSFEVYPTKATIIIARDFDLNDRLLTAPATECAGLYVLPDHYYIKVDCEGYSPEIYEINKEDISGKTAYSVAHSSGYTLRFTLQPVGGFLTVDSAVPAEIWCGEKKIGNTGEQIPLPAEQAHVIEIKAAGYKTERIRLRLSAKETSTQHVNLRLATGTLKVGIVAQDRAFAPFLPTNGVLYVDARDGIEILFPHVMELLPGQHEIKLVVPGFEPAGPDVIRTEINKNIDVSFKLIPINSSIVFTTNIKNNKVKIYANGKYIGNAGEEVFFPPFVSCGICLKTKGYEDEIGNITLPRPGMRYENYFILFDKPLPGLWKRMSEALTE